MKIDKLYLEVDNDDVEVGTSRLGFGFRTVSTLNERPGYMFYFSDYMSVYMYIYM